MLVAYHACSSRPHDRDAVVGAHYASCVAGRCSSFDVVRRRPSPKLAAKQRRRTNDEPETSLFLILDYRTHVQRTLYAAGSMVTIITVLNKLVSPDNDDLSN